MNTRLLIVVGVCLALGVGGGATWSVRQAASERALAARAAADTATTPDHEPPDTSATAVHGPDSATVADTSTVHPDTAEIGEPPPADPGTAGTDTIRNTASPDSAAIPPAPPTATDPVPVQRDTVEAADSTDAGRPARIFGAMRPEQAARILEGLDDRAALTVLLGLTDRKAAAILSNIKGARAASLARALLNHEGVR